MLWQAQKPHGHLIHCMRAATSPKAYPIDSLTLSLFASPSRCVSDASGSPCSVSRINVATLCRLHARLLPPS